jgi:Tfp pilus assembly protein FimT
MWLSATDRINRRGGRRAAALVTAVLLMMLLSVFATIAVGLFTATVSQSRSAEAAIRATCLAELARADATAYVTQNLGGPWPYAKALTTVTAADHSPAGQYVYTIQDRTLPDQNQRRLVQIDVYWPSQAACQVQRRLNLWMEQDSDWSVTARARGSYAGS